MLPTVKLFHKLQLNNKKITIRTFMIVEYRLYIIDLIQFIQLELVRHYFLSKSSFISLVIHAANDNENSSIKSASYMDELRQRLERVLNDAPHQTLTSYHRSHSSSHNPKGIINRSTLIPPPQFKPTNSQCLNSTENLRQKPNEVKASMIIGSTPLPRKQIQSFGNLSYRTMNATNRHRQSQMSKSFIVSSKREGYFSHFKFHIHVYRYIHAHILYFIPVDPQSASPLSIASKSDSLNLENADVSLRSTTPLNSLNNANKITTSVKSKPVVITSMNNNLSKQLTPLKKSVTSFRTNDQSQPSLPTKHENTSVSVQFSTLTAQIPKQNKPLNSTVPTPSLKNNKTATINTPNKVVPPVPPRKSSIPRPTLKPQPPQRNSSTNFRKTHVSHL